jgi:hypothetical protein
MEVNTIRCIHCDRSSDEAPLLALRFAGGEYWICSQHLPILIHKPSQLADKLPGADRLSPPTEGHH